MAFCSLSDTRSSTWDLYSYGSGPGGRRFESSLPDQVLYFQGYKAFISRLRK